MSDEGETPQLAQPQASTPERIHAAWTRQLDRLAMFFSAAYPALIVAALVFAFFTQPALRFLAIYPAFEGSMVLGLGIILVRVSYMLGRDVMGLVMGSAAVIVGAFWLDAAIESAMRTAAANDRRCWYIEREMLSARPRRSDLPDLFTALACRPQGDALAARTEPAAAATRPASGGR